MKARTVHWKARVPPQHRLTSVNTALPSTYVSSPGGGVMMVLAGAQGLMLMKLEQGREKGNENGNRLPKGPACNAHTTRASYPKPVDLTAPMQYYHVPSQENPIGAKLNCALPRAGRMRPP